MGMSSLAFGFIGLLVLFFIVLPALVFWDLFPKLLNSPYAQEILFKGQELPPYFKKMVNNPPDEVNKEATNN